MKRIGHLYPQIYSFANLLSAAQRALRGKRHKQEASEFYFHLEPNLLELSRELQDKTYRPQPFRRFIIHQPKERIIHAAPFRDRVVHHALCYHLEPCFEKFLIHHTYGCRKDKGPIKTMDYTAELCKKFPYFLKCDIRKFFNSIDHAVLKEMLAHKFKDPDLLWLLATIIDHQPPESLPGKSIPIGNFTSQYFANLYLDGLDHYLKETLRIPGYVRYMDDFILFSQSKEELWEALRQSQNFLGNIQLDLSQSLVAPVSQGVPFLGYRFFNGLIRIQQTKWRRFKKRFRATQDAFLRGEIPETRFLNAIRGLVNAVAYGNTHHLRQKFFARYSIDY